MSFEILHSADDFRVGRVGDVLILRVQPPPTPGKLAILNDLLTKLRERKIVLLVSYDLRRFSGGPPSAEIRAQLRSVISRHIANLGAVALVLERSGLAAAMFRSAITGMLMVTRPAIPLKLFSEAKEAFSWLHTIGVLGADVREKELEEGLAKLVV